MRIAYLILAHDTPLHVSRLVGALESPNAAFFIHIDRKSDLQPFRRRLSAPNINFLDDRVAIYWGEFAIVEATIRLMKAALRDSPAPDYVCLLSGSDYPLKRALYIERFFSRNEGKEFISLVAMPCEAAGKPLERIQRYYLQTPANCSLVRKIVPRINRFIREQLRFRRNHIRFLGDMVPFAGSQWWALSADACRYVVRFVETEPKIVGFFRNVPIPDESFFHTILGNSRFRENARRHLTLSNWQGSHPALIQIKDIAPFAGGKPIIDGGIYGEGEVLFARKFGDDSDDVIEFIDSHLLAAEQSA
jgi:hypothetical protein